MNKFASNLFDETTFYQSFLKDLHHSRKEVIIESPFITAKRMEKLSGVFNDLIERGVKVYVMTRDPNEHESRMREEAEAEIRKFEIMGIQVLLCTGNDHRKLAMIDREILWEGSLNILSQQKSREIMRRIDDQDITLGMFNFLKLERFMKV